MGFGTATLHGAKLLRFGVLSQVVAAVVIPLISEWPAE